MKTKPANNNRLDLNSCWKLTTLPPEVGRLGKLEWLDLTPCENFESLPLELAGAVNLSSASLYGTKVSADNVAALRRLLPGCSIEP